MRLFDATLDLARYAQGIETHKISGVTGDKSFRSAQLAAKLGEYTAGDARRKFACEPLAERVKTQ